MLDVKKMQASAKKIAKESKLFISKKDDRYFITNSFYLIIVNKSIYRGAFNAAAPEFKEIEDGATIARQNKGEMPEPIPYMDMTRMIPAKSLIAIKSTAYSYNMGAFNGKDRITKLYINNGGIIAVDEKYMDAVAPFIHTDELYQEEGKSPEYNPIYSGDIQNWKNDDFFSGVCVLPIRQEIAKNDITIIDQSIAAPKASGKNTEDAEKIAAEIIAKAKADAEKIKADAEKAAEEYKAEIENLTEKAKEKSKAITAEIIEKAKAEAQAIRDDAEKQAEMTKKHEKAAAEIVHNEEKHGIELYFKTFPAAETRNELKANHWRWYPAKKCWYAKATPENIALAEKIAA